LTLDLGRLERIVPGLAPSLYRGNVDEVVADCIIVCPAAVAREHVETCWASSKLQQMVLAPGCSLDPYSINFAKLFLSAC